MWFVIIEPTVTCVTDFVLYNDRTFSTCVYCVLIYFTLLLMDTPDEEELQNNLVSQDNVNKTPMLGTKFDSFDELQSAVDCFQKANFCQFYIKT